MINGIFHLLLKMMKKLAVILWLLSSVHWGIAQNKEVAITIDDVPNTKRFAGHEFSSNLLSVINLLELPVTIFINEKNIYTNQLQADNKECLTKWLKSPHITAGNHSYSHLNYSDTTFEAFREDVEKGSLITKEILKSRPRYFRFPYNSMGKDSAAHHQIKEYLKSSGYVNTPFTIESEDWMFNTAYEEALTKGDGEKAEKIARAYISYTISLFEYFEKICNDVYGRNVRHIYLCHDNQLNAYYLTDLLSALSKTGYKFITLDDALKDKIYQSKDYYTGPFGFSWVYRWQKDEAKRKSLMRGEPVHDTLK